MHSLSPIGPATPAGPPKLRQDLVLRQHGSAAGSSLVVKDPSTGRYYRFRETEAFILRLLDGAMPLEALRRKVEDCFGASLPLPVLEGFVGKLRGLGLLAEGSPETARQAGVGRIR